MNSDAIPYKIYHLGQSLSEDSWMYFIRNETNLIIIRIGNKCLGMASERIGYTEDPAIYLVEKNRILSIQKGEKGMLQADTFNLIDNPLIAQLIISIRREMFYRNTDEYYLSCMAGALLKQIRKHKSYLNLHEESIKLITPFQMKRLKEYVLNNLVNPVSLEEMARYLGYSSYHFCRIFKRTIGISPVQWLKELRMQEALKLLYEGNTNVASVSYQIGYKNLSHFSKVFRTKYGYTPSQVLMI